MDESNVRVCPECGRALNELDCYAHALEHYPEYLDPAKSSKLARLRQRQIMEGGVSLAEYDVYRNKEGE